MIAKEPANEADVTHTHSRARLGYQYIGFALVFSCALFLVSALGCTPAEETADLSVENAREAYERADFLGAIEDLEAIVESDPDDLEARELLALSYAAVGENESAIEQYAYVIERDSTNHAALYRAAVLERIVGKTDDAIEHLEAAADLSSDPTYTDDLARTYMQVGRFEDAAAAWGRLLADDSLATEGRIEILRVQADAYQSAKDYDSAIAALEEAVQLAPNDEALKTRLEALRQ